MKFVTVRDFRTGPGKVWQNLKKAQELVITSNGHPVGLLLPIDGDTLETSLQAYRQARAQLALDEIQRESVKKGSDKISMEEIDQEIKATRRSRK